MKISNKVSLIILSASMFLGPVIAHAATAPNLGTAASFSVFAGSAMTADGSGATVAGDLGVNPGLSVSGPWTVGGSEYFGTGGLSGTAKIDATAAWTTMGSSGGTAWDPAVPADMTPAPGLYTRSGDATVTGTLTLNGSATDVWIFQINSSLTFTNAATVTLTGGASACNVFWRIASDATINGSPGKQFAGTLIANSNVSLITGATVIGRMMTLTGTLSTAGVTNISGCATAAPHIGSSPVNLPPIYPLINVTKIPSPLNLPAGPGPVTYTYKVTNIGIVPVANVSVKDNKCNPALFVSGDTNNDKILDLTETWTYNCFKTVSQTETNVVTACGSAANISSSGSMCDTAQATVAVGVPVIPPLIHVVKTPSTFLLPAGGGLVTYQYYITNPGTEPLSDVGISDDKCPGLPVRIASHVGDVNGNKLLDPGETWNFSCVSNLTKTTTNTGTATGSANGFTATDSSSATVVVLAPSFPKAGLPPYGTSTPMDAAIVAGILMMILASLSVIQKKLRV